MPAINSIITITLFGRACKVRVLAVHPFGTIDVQRADGECFRVSGLSF